MTLSSPPLRDDATSWFNVENALAALRRHGGGPAVTTTTRLRIDAGRFAGSVGRYQALLGLVGAHQDVLHRLAGDPAGRAPAPAWHQPALDEAGVALIPPWSGGLDTATVQIRTRLWLGLLAAALRLAGSPELTERPPTPRPGGHEGVDQPVRYPRDRPLISGRIAVYEPGSPAETRVARDLIDAALTSPADRERAAALFHLTPWPGAKSTRVQARRGEGWASFGHPSRVLPLDPHRSDAALFGAGTFVADLDLSPRSAVPVVYGATGAAAVTPAQCALLLREAGYRPGAPVALRIPPGPRQDRAATTSWIKALARSLNAPVYLAFDGARLAELPDSVLDGFTLYTAADEVRPGFDWVLTPPREVWLGCGRAMEPEPAVHRLVALPDRGLRTFVRDASWHGAGSCVLFAPPVELGRLVRQAEGLEQYSGLITAVFAQARGGVPQVTVDGGERDLAPAELGAVLFRHAGAAPGAELRLLVLDALAPDDGVWRRWAGLAAAAAGRIVHYPAPHTSVLIPESRQRRRGGGKPPDYGLAAASGADPAEPRWLTARPGPAAPRSVFLDDRGWLRPTAQIPQEEPWPARRS